MLSLKMSKVLLIKYSLTNEEVEMQIVLENMFIKGLLWFIWIINTISFWLVAPNIFNFLTMLLLVCVFIEGKRTSL